MKPPKNFYNAVDRRKLDISDNLLPDVTTSDAGKVLKVSEAGAWQLANDENTIIEANPDEQPTVDLENLKIGDTVYSVNKPTFEMIKAIRVTIADGGQYRTDKPKIEFYDDAGNLMTYPSYASSCDKDYAGNISLDQVCSVATGDAPGAFTYVFAYDVIVTTYHLIKLTNAGSFAGDIAKNVKIELSSDGENFITLWEDPSISWSGSSGASRILDIKTGELADTILPIVTSADNGKVLGVVNGEWDKMAASNTVIIPCTVSSTTLTLTGYTRQDISDLISNGANVILRTSDTSHIEYHYVWMQNIADRRSPIFLSVFRDASSVTYYKVTFEMTAPTSTTGVIVNYEVNDPT